LFAFYLAGSMKEYLINRRGAEDAKEEERGVNGGDVRQPNSLCFNK
jgi:hypothetical protein